MMLMRETTRPTSPMVFDQAGVGFVRPVFETATGIACLSAYPPEQRRILLNAFLSGAMGPPPDAEVVERLVERAAEQGYSARPPGFAQKTNAIAVPIPGEGGPLGTIAFTFLNSAMTEDDAAAAYLRRLQQAAAKIAANHSRMRGEALPTKRLRTESRPRWPSP
jgi:DNA-binding IclR family transcriptional regulator